MGGVHQDYSVHVGEDAIYIEGGGEVLYIDRMNGLGKFLGDVHKTDHRSLHPPGCHELGVLILFLNFG